MLQWIPGITRVNFILLDRGYQAFPDVTLFMPSASFPSLDFSYLCFSHTGLLLVSQPATVISILEGEHQGKVQGGSRLPTEQGAEHGVQSQDPEIVT